MEGMPNRTTIHQGPLAETDLVLVGKDLADTDLGLADRGRDLAVDRARRGSGSTCTKEAQVHLEKVFDRLE
ncbi:MAG: hypothetical protein L6R38_000990 [Xanthoria sp. 2 TBL-2021]|nr:MAG: hypothetical protein L6R38_000990 [Xanthoria sp. 2 TBL-2021]